MSVNSILEKIAATPGKNDKIAILAENKNDLGLKLAIELCYNPTINFFIKKIPDYTAGMCSPQLTLSQALTALGDLSSRKVTGDAARNTLGWILQNCSVEDAKVVAKVVQRDLRAGFTDGTANKVWKNLIPEFDVMLSHKDISGIKFPAYAQIKSDGARCHMMLRNGEAVAFSRNGKAIELHGNFNAALTQLVNDGETLDGELLAMKDGKILDRKTGNGIVNSLINITDKRQKLEDKICQLEQKLKELSTSQ